MPFNGKRGENKTPYKHKPNRGSMFENDDKQKDSQPDFKGSIDVEGVIYWINGWKDTTMAGKHRLSLSVTHQEELDQPREQGQPRQPQGRQQQTRSPRW